MQVAFMGQSYGQSPLARYREDLRNPAFQHDPAQEQVVNHLQALYEALLAAPPRPVGWRRWVPFLPRQRRQPVRGLYLWGGVGRGKTYLMDTFYDSLPFKDKKRAHFHRFMRHIHAELKTLAGRADPLETVAERLSAEARVICFDEFFVSDITDAMLLGNLLQGLFERGVSLVATSNIVPDELYKDGLQRQRFLPAIDLIKQHTKVVHVDSAVDYRLRALEQAELFHYPLDDQADQSLEASFLSLLPEHSEVEENTHLEVEGRTIPARRVGEDVAWFDFPAICDGPRSQNDYIELAREYHAVVVSNVPAFSEANNDQARRFISLVDEFYDRNVKLVLSASRPLETLYESGRLRFEFERTMSRLLEMQSHDYLARPHRP